MKRTLILATVVLLAAGLALAQCPMGQGKGQGPRGGDMMGNCGMKGGGPGAGTGRGQWWENPEVVQKLGLTPEQTGKIDQMALKHRKEMVKLQSDLKIARMEMQELLEDNASDPDVRKKAAELKLLNGREDDARIEHLLEVRKVLTADQQKKLKAAKMGGHRQMNKGDCCPGSDK